MPKTFHPCPVCQEQTYKKFCSGACRQRDFRARNPGHADLEGKVTILWNVYHGQTFSKDKIAANMVVLKEMVEQLTVRLDKQKAYLLSLEQKLGIYINKEIRKARFQALKAESREPDEPVLDQEYEG